MSLEQTCVAMTNGRQYDRFDTIRPSHTRDAHSDDVHCFSLNTSSDEEEIHSKSFIYQLMHNSVALREY